MSVLKTTRGPALRAMTELWIIGLVGKPEDDLTNPIHPTKRITLNEEFNWLLSKEFSELRKGFKPVDYRPR
jgi:hypothetical protein